MIVTVLPETVATLGFPLEKVTVSLHHSRIHARDCADCDTKVGLLDQISVEIELTGALTPEQHATLIEVAHKCPVHRTLTSEIKIQIQDTRASVSS